MDEEDGSTLTVRMGLRTHEKEQLGNYIEEIMEQLIDLGLPQSAEELEDVEIVWDERGPPGHRYGAEATPDEWRTVISSLSNEDTLRSDWLRRKLARRLHDRLDEMQEAVDA